MKKSFLFDELTWPEVARLSRLTPLILPLGTDLSENWLEHTFEKYEHVGILPNFPYGWYGSGLRIAENTLRQFLDNLISSVRDDGFINVFTATPQGLDFGLQPARIAVPDSESLANKPVWVNSIPLDTDRDKVILIPIGHTEQHGFHLPLSTDTLIVDAICQGVAKILPQKTTTLPVMPYGVSTHRKSFAGTLNAGGRAFEDFYLNVLDILVARGFKKFYLISGHGGNSSFLVNIIKYIGERYLDIFCATSYLYLSGPEGVNTLEKYRQSPIGGMGHACELETSLILHLRPDLVYMDRAIDETSFISTPSYYMDWVEGGALIANPPWYDDTSTGAYGAGSLGTAEKGNIWLDAAINEKIDHVGEIIEQYSRRLERKVTFPIPAHIAINNKRSID